MEKADERRRLAVAAYEGGMRLGAVARDYGVNPRTILDWSARFRPADTPRRRPKRRPIEVGIDYIEEYKPALTMIDHDSVHVAGINRGTGGSMSDHQVREATVRLEKSIIALQRKRGWQTFTYAKEA
jgi:transposase-like protein